MKLNDPVTKVKYINSKYAVGLERLEITTVKDLLTHFPREYNDSSKTAEIADILLQPSFEEKYLIKATVKEYKNIRIRGGRSLQTVVVFDDTSELVCKFFNQEYLSRVLKPGKEFYFQGKLKQFGRKLEFSPTVYDEVQDGKETLHLGRLVPEYALTAGVTKKWFRNRMKSVVDLLNEGELDVENEFLALDNKFNLKNYIETVHFPGQDSDLEKSVEQLSLLELTNLQLKLEEKRAKATKFSYPLVRYADYKRELDEFIESLEFELTADQKKVINSLTKKLKEGQGINSLVQGDVGTGKTIVAVYLSLLMALERKQIVLLAPTTILAKQHFDNFQKLLKDYKVTVELVSSDNKDSQKADILIGTTAVLARKTNLIDNLGLIIVDEQHRFGVRQREELLKPFLNLSAKDKTSKMRPHLMNLSATPIPRTIAEAFFGDLEVQTIKTKPKGRKPVKTRLVDKLKKKQMYDWIRSKVKDEKEQVYWICPLVEPSEKKELKLMDEDIDLDQIKSVTEVYEALSKEFSDIKVGFIHGKMKNSEKTEIMKQFAENKLQILISTTVIEVGVDVANATVMVIENAERFGLAQLHQIRGRVGRSDKESWCMLFTAGEISFLAEERLKFFTNNNDGLEIAKFDLETRGPGEVYGTKQAGIPNFKIAKFNNLELLKRSRELAEELYSNGLRKIELFS